jgi:cobalt-zinc-cadmium efflux system protein
MADVHQHHDHGNRPHGHHDRDHQGSGAKPGVLLTALAFTFGFACVEAAGGWLSGSLALVSDAGHMLSDTGALGLAAFAGWIARRPPSTRHSYGLVRAEVIAASLNGLFMVALIAWICYEAFQRLRDPQPVAGGSVMVIAAIGLAINLVVARTLSHGGHDLNTRAAFLHVLGDLLGSVAALAAGAVVYFTGWLPIDPLLSLLVAGLILASTVRLLRDALHVLMEGVPADLDFDAIGNEMARVEGVRGIHDLHIWTLGSGNAALSAHVELASLRSWPEVLRRLREMLHERFDVDHVTLQPEVVPSRSPPRGKVIPIHQRLP